MQLSAVDLTGEVQHIAFFGGLFRLLLRGLGVLTVVVIGAIGLIDGAGFKGILTFIAFDT